MKPAEYIVVTTTVPAAPVVTMNPSSGNEFPSGTMSIPETELNCPPLSNLVKAAPRPHQDFPHTAAIPADVSETEIKTFTVNGHPVRGLKVDGKAAVVGADFAAAMGYADPNAAIKRHCKGTTKRRIPTASGIQDMVVIFQGDINRLICNSTLPSAEAFEKEVMEVILPAIQQTGTYTVTPARARAKLVTLEWALWLLRRRRSPPKLSWQCLIAISNIRPTIPATDSKY
ncbi:MAG: Bro-N domain-containing protein [Terrimicrobiaceae bacterium]